jgi:hypothetical protein
MPRKSIWARLNYVHIPGFRVKSTNTGDDCCVVQRTLESDTAKSDGRCINLESPVVIEGAVREWLGVGGWGHHSL